MFLLKTLTDPECNRDIWNKAEEILFIRNGKLEVSVNVRKLMKIAAGIDRGLLVFVAVTLCVKADHCALHNILNKKNICIEISRVVTKNDFFAPVSTRSQTGNNGIPSFEDQGTKNDFEPEMLYG